MAKIKIGQIDYFGSPGDDPGREDPLAPPTVSTGPTADEWAGDWKLDPPTIADIFREKAVTLAEQRAEAAARPPEPPADPAWAEGIDPASLAIETQRAYLPGQMEQTGLIRSAQALAGLTLAGRPGEQGVRGIAKELGIPRFSRMRKDPLIQAITAEAWQRDLGDVPSTLAEMGATDVTMLQAGLSPAGAAVAGMAMPKRREIYTQSQSLFGFSAQNVDVAMARGGIPWSAVESMSDQQVLSIIHNTVANEFIARGGSKEFIGPEGEEEIRYFASRAVQDMVAKGEGEAASTAARLVPGAAGAALGQAWALQRGITPERGTQPSLGPRNVYRGTRLTTDVKAPLQSAGVAAEFDEQGLPTQWVAGDPAKASKRMSQLMQEFGVTMSGLETVQSKVLGQMAEIPETIQVADAWISFGDWLPQGSAMYGKGAGRPTRTMTRRVRLPEGEELTIKPGQVFKAGERVRLFGSHVGYDWSKDFEQVVVQHAEMVTKYDRGGKKYQEIEFQALGTSYPGALTAFKHWMKGGAARSAVVDKMDVDMIVAPNEIYQLGAAIASVATPKQRREIWGEEGLEQWGPESGKRFVEWMLGSKSPLEERLIPAQTFGLSDPETQKLIEMGRLINPKTGEAITQENLKGALIPGTQEAISAQILDIGMKHRLGFRASMVFAGSTHELGEGAFGAVAEQYPKLAKLMYQQGVGHQRMMSHLTASIAANVDPGSEVGATFIKKAIPAAQIGRAWPKFAEQAGDLMRGAGYKEPAKAPKTMRSLIMSLIGEAHPGRGIALEGAEGATRYFPNPLTLSRTFGFQFQERDVGGRKVSILNQLPSNVASILEDASQRELRGGEYIPPDMIPADKTPADYTEQELKQMSETYRASRVEAAHENLVVGSSTKGSIQSLMGVSTNRMVGPHPTGVLGTPLTKFITSDRILKQMLGAATSGASEEDLAELQELVTMGKLPGPELVVAGYPIVDPGQAKIALSYMRPDDVISRGLVDTREELEEMFGGRIGVNQSIAYMQEKDWDIDEFLRLVKGQYTKKGGEWTFDPLGKAATESELRTMLRAIAISGEEASALEKMERGSTMGGIRKRLEEARDAPPLAFDELQRMSEEKILGGRIKGMAYNIMLRNVQARMKGPTMEGGHQALADARRTQAIPFQTALDLKPIEGGWRNIVERLYTFNLASRGWQRGGLYDKAAGTPENYLKTGLLGYVDDTIQDVLDLKKMTDKDKPVEARHLAATLVSPAVDEERWQNLTGLIGRYQAGEKGLTGDIRQAVYGGLKAGPNALAEERGGALKELHERSPLLSVGLEAAAFKAVAKGDVIPGEKVWRKTPSGAYKSTEFGEESLWLAEQGELMKRSIQAMSPLRHLSDVERAAQWNLWARAEAVEAQATEHPYAAAPRRALATRAMKLAMGPAVEKPGSWQDFIARQGAGAEGAPVEMMARQGSGMGVLQQMLGKEAPAAANLRSVVSEAVQSAIGIEPGAEGSAAQVYEFVKASQKTRTGVRGPGGDWEEQPAMSPLRQALNKLLGGMEQKERPEALGLWRQEVGKYGLTMATGQGGMYHEYQEYAGRYERFAAAEKFPNAGDNEPADIPAFIQPSEAGLLRHLEKEQIPPDKVTSAIASAPSSSERFAAVRAEYQTMGDEEQAAYRARFSKLDPNVDLAGRQDKRYVLQTTEGLYGPSFQNPSVEDMLRFEREAAAQVEQGDPSTVTGTRITQEGLTLMQQTLQGLMGAGGISFYGRSTESGDISGTFRPLEERPGLTPMQHAMATQFMGQVPGMGEVEFLRGVSGLGLGGIAPGLERLRGGKLPTAGQMGKIEEMLGIPGADIALGLGQDRPAAGVSTRAAAVGGPPTIPLGATEMGGDAYDIRGYMEPDVVAAADALEKFTESLGVVQESLDEYGDTMKEQITAYEEGRLKLGPDEERQWKADVRAMATQARAVTGAAGALPGGVPQGLAGRVGQWGGLLQQAQGAGLAPEMGAGFAGAEVQGGLRGFLGGLVRPGGRGPLGEQGPMRGIEGVYSQLTSYWKMFRMQRLWGMTGGAAMGQIPMAAQEEQAATQAAMATMPMGQFAVGGMTRDLMAYGAQRQAWQADVGRAAHGAWGWAQQGGLGEGAATAAGILGPALGIGAVAGTAAAALVPGLAATAVGIPIAAVAAGVGAVRYAGEAMGDRERMAMELAQQETQPGFLGQEQQPLSLAGARARMEEAPEWWQTLMLGKDQTFFGMDVGAQQPRGEVPLAEYGQQLLTGPLSQLRPAGRAAAIQGAAGRAIEEEGPLYGFAQPAVSAALGQWYAATPGAEEQAPSEILADPRFAAMMGRGMQPGAFGQIAGQWGMAPRRWEEVQAQMGGVSQAQAGETEFVAGQWRGLRQFGVGGARIREAAYGGEIGELTPGGEFQLGRLTGGSRAAWTQYGREQGISAYQTVDPTTGMGVGTTWGSDILAQRIMGGETGLATTGGRVGGYDPGVQRGVEGMDITINAGRAFVNIGGEQTEMTQWALQARGQEMRQEERRWGAEQARGRFELQQGYVMGTGQFEGRGQWDYQDRQRQMQYGRQMEQFGFAQEGLDLNLQQFQERQGLQAGRFEWQTQRQREDIGIQYQRQQARFGWAEEDLSYRGAQSAMQFGWQMEDVGEQLRYATGRERRQLMKQRERATVQFGMGMGRLDVEEGRLDQRKAWAEEDHQRGKQYFEQRVQWTRQEMDLSKRHFMERHGLSQRRLTADKTYFQSTFEFQGERIETEREYWVEQQGFAEAQLAHAEAQVGMWEQYEVAVLNVNNAITLQNAQWAAMFDAGGPVQRASQAIASMFDYIEQRAGSVGGGYDNTVQNDPYHRGGPGGGT